MNNLVKAARDALDLIEKIDTGIYSTNEVVGRLRAAAERAESDDEPVSWMWLTDDEVKQVIRQTIPDVTVSESVTFRAIARAIKAAVMEKNQ